MSMNKYFYMAAIAAAAVAGAPNRAAAQVKLVAYWDFEKLEADGLSLKSVIGGHQGAISGSAAESYLRRIGVETVTFKSENEELQSLNQGRIKAALEDDVVFLEFQREVPNNKMEPLWSIATPDDIIYGGGYGYARYALRKEDCSLRSAYTQALAEIRGNGQMSAILKKFGLGDRNLFWFKLNP